MTRQELLTLALRSPKDAEKVSSYIVGLKGREDSKAFFFAAIATIESLISNPKIRNHFFKVLTETAPNVHIVQGLESLLENTAITEQQAKSLVGIALRHPDSRIPAISVMSRNVPPDIVNMIATKFGLGQKTLANQIQLRDIMWKSIQTEISLGTRWDNEQSGIIFGMPLLKNKSDPRIKNIVETGTLFPDTFINAVTNFADKDIKVVMKSKSRHRLPDLLHELTEATNLEDTVKLVRNYLENPMATADDKVSLFKYADENLPQYVCWQTIGNLSRIPNERTFHLALYYLKQPNGYYDVEALTSNLSLVMLYGNDVEDALNKRGLLHRATPEFRSYIEQREQFFDIDEDELTEEEMTLFGNF